ncbi:MAG: hypothetical protein JWM21_4400 [Acidobacteria bacterium]|nr:hypothetical protein [Acidobacteriota bacterium]
MKAIFAGQDQQQEIAKGADKPGHFHTRTILDENPTSCQRKINEAEKDSVNRYWCVCRSRLSNGEIVSISADAPQELNVYS